MADRRVSLWRPNPGPQTEFVTSSANEVLYGGAAGGGKSAALVALPLRWVDRPRFRALILRRESTQLPDLLDKARALYPHFGARENLTTRTWRFPSGAVVRFNHCEHETDAAIYDGQEFQLVGFDELTHFTETQYRAIRARVRSTDATLPRYTRATTNPGGPGHEWVFNRFAAWLDPAHARRAAPGEVRWFAGGEAAAPDALFALSRTFIPALLRDNPHVTGDYEATLRDLDPVRREQLLAGDWLVKPAAGLYFKRDWLLPEVDALPGEVVARARYWDRASTEGGGDWTAGVRMARVRHPATRDEWYVVEDVIRVRRGPGGVQDAVATAARTDPPGTYVLLEQDPGQAGKVEAEHYVRALAGFPVLALPKRVDKIVAASPLSSMAAAKRVRLLRGPWVRTFLAELEAFPEDAHDDQVDAASGAFTFLSRGGTPGRVQSVGTPRSTAWG